ncbi:MAG: ribonucleoside-diphosphate reductase subunit alpha, partial [Roseateles sp.]
MNADLAAARGVIKRDGTVVVFNPEKIVTAIKKAWLDVFKGVGGQRMFDVAQRAAELVTVALLRDESRSNFHIEDIQDQVELQLMRMGEHELARGYIVYREQHAQVRASRHAASPEAPHQLTVIDGGMRRPLDLGALKALIASACENLGADVKPEPVLAETQRNLYDGVPMEEVYKAAILAARTLIEKDPGYSRATARLLMHTIRREILGEEVTQEQMQERYAEYFPRY